MLHAELLLWSGELRSGRKLLAAVHEDIVRTGNEVNHPYCLFDLSLLECAAGNAALAAELAREGVEAARDTADTWGETVLLYPLALANAWLGRAEPARAAAERRLDEASWRGERPGIVRAHSVLGLLALSEGNAGSAARLLAEAAELLEEMGFANPGAFPILPDAVEALAAGERPRAPPRRCSSGSTSRRPRATTPGLLRRPSAPAARCCSPAGRPTPPPSASRPPPRASTAWATQRTAPALSCSTARRCSGAGSGRSRRRCSPTHALASRAWAPRSGRRARRRTSSAPRPAEPPAG